MEISMKDVINSYRQQLSDALHQTTLKELHIQNLEKTLDEKLEKIIELQTELDFYRIAEHERQHPLDEEPDDWTEDTVDRLEDYNGDSGN